MLGVGPRFRTGVAVCLLGASLAWANGLGYGSGNLRQYLLHGLNEVDPDFLANDWFTTQTRAHHTAFNQMIVAAARLLPLDAAFVLLNAVFSMGFVACIYFLARRFYRAPLIVTALAAFIVIFTRLPYLGWTCIINGYFQPSTVGAVGLVAGLTCLCHARYRSAGAIFLVAGVFHINYMVWIIVIVGCVVALNLHRIGVRSALHVLVPIALSVLYHLPFIHESRSPQQAAHLADASRILHDIYMPYHSRPLTWGVSPFIRFAVQLLAGAAAWLAFPPAKAPDRVTLTILATISAIVGLGAVFTMAFPIDSVALVFPYRMAPLLILAAQIAVAGAIVSSALSERVTLSRTFASWVVLGGLLYATGVNTYGLRWLGAFAGALLAARLADESGLVRWKTLVAPWAVVIVLYLAGAGPFQLAFVALFAAAATASPAVDGLKSAIRWRHVPALGRAAVVLGITALLSRIGAQRKDLAGPAPPAKDRVLYEWCRSHTDRDEVFIVPPDLGRFRLEAERAVVVDWKCMPILPKDTIEWYRRLVTICGGEFSHLREAKSGFEHLSPERARRLADEFDVRYLVTSRKNQQENLDQIPCAFVSDAYAVLDLRFDDGRPDQSR